MSERAKIIETARRLDAHMLACAAGTARYEGADDLELAAAIDIISAHGRADELAGDRKHGRHGARIGRYVLWSNSQRVAALQSSRTSGPLR